MTKPICYDTLGNPVFVGDLVLVANRGELTKALVQSITKPKRTISKPKPTMVVHWQENQHGKLWPSYHGQQWKPCEGKLKLNSCEWKLPDLLQVHRIIKIERV